MERTTSLFEISDASPETRWSAVPGKQCAFGLVVRNVTNEAHDIELGVDQPTDLARIEPHRLNLDPGERADVSIIFCVPLNAPVAAGPHTSIIRIRELDGIVLGEWEHPVEVEERQELSLSMTVHGPRVSYGLAAGFVLRCIVTNRGNCDATVAASADAHGSLTLQQRTVQVPCQGEVSFNLEFGWKPSHAADHPESITVRIPYRGGEAAATLAWSAVAAVLDPYMPIAPPLDDEEDPLSLKWLPDEEREPQPAAPPTLEAAPGAGDPGAATAGPAEALAAADAAARISSDGTLGAPSETVPRERIVAPGSQHQTYRYTFGRKINPWWPLLEQFGGRWCVKWRPILLFVLALESSFIVWQQQYIEHLQVMGISPAAVDVKAIKRAHEHAQAKRKASHAKLLSGGAAPTRVPPVHVLPRLAARAPARALPASPAPRPPARPRASATAVPAAPALFGLSARYRGPSALTVSFVRHGLVRVSVSASNGAKTVARALNVPGSSTNLKLPAGYASPTLVQVVGTTQDGKTIRRSVWIPQYRR